MQTTIAVAALLATGALAGTTMDYEAMFLQYKGTHLKAYANAAEESVRKQNFITNMKQAEALQAANPLATFGINKFADLSAAEFKASHHNADKFFLQSAQAKKENVFALNNVNAAKAAGQKIDWRQKGAVLPVKDQGQCGSCWAFSTAGNIESAWFIAGNPLISLSEQELVSCDSTNQGCDGGLEYDAWAWLIKNHKGGITTTAAMPYTSGSGSVASCPSNLNSLPVGATINSFVHIAKSEDAMADYTYNTGVLSVGVDATSWMSYTSGIMTNCISQSMDHSVLVVGFDDTNVPPYWIVRNSWGPSWGEAGYIRVAKGSNQCLIKDDVSAVTINKK